MAFFRAIGGALETAGRGVVAGVQLGLNEDSNRACEKAADRTAKAATTVIVDTGGFVASGVAPAVQGIGHGAAAAGCAVADVATFGKVAELSKARDDQAKRAGKKFQQAEAGVARAAQARCLSFNDSPSDVGPWMRGLPHSTKVVDLFLPGTHDSVARIGGDYVECQSWTITDQLRSGIRCFDLRFRMVDDAFCGHHGKFYQDITFGGVADQFEEFLNRHPSEAIFVTITGDGCSHASEHDFEELLQSKILGRGRNLRMWEMFSVHLAGATLGELRSRIVAFDGRCCGAHRIDRQDKWTLGDAGEKWDTVLSHATQQRDPCTLYINNMNSVGRDGMTYSTPAAIAYQVNSKALGSVGSFRPGVYLMDYPGTGLVRELFQRNAQ
mmetsp:Transcript_102475/g.235112  ORF Transcript_102475/g.235112 Transcript_102475/m.235112 type:complete len:383 (-) Transcript_102475:126-1274(-)